jgi:large subunit ribosomal protein L9
MRVILLDYVYKHGVAGEVINVADGFARNYLIPNGLAIKATPGELRRAEKLRAQAEVKRAALANELNELARIIEGVELIFGRRAASTGKLFGSVTTQEVADALREKTGVEVNRRRISQQPLREIGTHDVPIRLGSDSSPSIKVTIVREEELADFLAKRAAAAAKTVEAEPKKPGREDAPREEGIGNGDEENARTEILPASKVREMIERGKQEETIPAETESQPEENSESE